MADINAIVDQISALTLGEAAELKKALEEKGLKPEEAEIQMIPENTVRVDGKEAESVLKLMELLEDNEDIQHVYANFDIDEKVLAAFNAE